MGGPKSPFWHIQKISIKMFYFFFNLFALAWRDTQRCTSRSRISAAWALLPSVAPRWAPSDACWNDSVGAPRSRSAQTEWSCSLKHVFFACIICFFSDSFLCFSILFRVFSMLHKFMIIMLLFQSDSLHAMLPLFRPFLPRFKVQSASLWKDGKQEQSTDDSESSANWEQASFNTCDNLFIVRSATPDAACVRHRLCVSDQTMVRWWTKTEKGQLKQHREWTRKKQRTQNKFDHGTFQGMIFQQVLHSFFRHTEAAAKVVLQLLTVLVHQTLFEGLPLLVKFHEEVPFKGFRSAKSRRNSNRRLHTH